MGDKRGRKNKTFNTLNKIRGCLFQKMSVKRKKKEGGDEKVSKPTCSGCNCDVPKR